MRSEFSARPPLARDEFLEGLRDFSEHRVLVVGDLFLDEYVEGEMFEISKEGPIPVVRVESVRRAAGAAGNLASSIRNLGAEVALVAVVGDDANGAVVRAELDAKGVDTSGILVRPEARTLTYSKLRARVENAPSREILRLDTLPDAPLSAALEREIAAALEARVAHADAVVVLDQIDHLVTAPILETLRALCERSHAFLQGSSRERLALLRGFDLVIPNDRECRLALGRPERASTPRLAEDEIAALGRGVLEAGGHRQVLLTLGGQGMAVFVRDDPDVFRVPTFAEEVVDVTGAGDAVSSTAVLASLRGWSLDAVAWLASQSAAIAIAQVGTHHVTREELAERVRAAY